MTKEDLMGKRVKPANEFNFMFYDGPKDKDSVGTITDIDDDDDGQVFVTWDHSGKETDHFIRADRGEHNDFAVVIIE